MGCEAEGEEGETGKESCDDARAEGGAEGEEVDEVDWKCCGKVHVQICEISRQGELQEIRATGSSHVFDTGLLPDSSPQLTQVIAEKEKKSSSYKENRLESLSDEKVAKIKKFSKDYIAKVLHKLEKSKRPRHSHSSSSTVNATPSSSTVMDTPNSNDGADGSANGEPPMQMSVEEAMGMEEDVDSELDDSDDDDEEDHQESSPMKASSSMNVIKGRDGDGMDIDRSPLPSTSSFVEAGRMEE